MDDILGLINALRAEGDKADLAELARRFGVEEPLVLSTAAALSRQPVQRASNAKGFRETLSGNARMLSELVSRHWLLHLVAATVPLIVLQGAALIYLVPLTEKVPRRDLHIPLSIGVFCIWVGLFFWKVTSWHRARRTWLLILSAPLTLLTMGIPTIETAVGWSIAYGLLAALSLLIVNLRATSSETARRANPSRQELVQRALDIRKALAETDSKEALSRYDSLLDTIRLKSTAALAVFLTCFLAVDLVVHLSTKPGKVENVIGGLLFLFWCTVATQSGQKIRPTMWLLTATSVHIAAVAMAGNVNDRQVGLLSQILWFSVPLLPFMILAIAVGQIFGARRRAGRVRSGDRYILVEELLEAEHMLRANTGEVTAVVVDVAGSTKMKEGLDPLEVEWTYREYQRMLAEEAKECGGRVLSTAGDGAALAFEDSQAAVACALAIQARVEEFNSKVSRVPVPFRLRIGVHCGEVQGELGEVQFSRVIDVAAHVEALSPVGKVAITDSVASKLYGFTAAGLEKSTDGHGILLVEKGISTP
ncbi:MAG TPA: adenylate/guanylate cyclase domain-containing protein [Fimbriimonadaceae bacterium]|nr:adenylate/guanylate cyclase domain-containing protein [Fimbriimonadaceae bacterium]